MFRFLYGMDYDFFVPFLKDVIPQLIHLDTLRICFQYIGHIFLRYPNWVTLFPPTPPTPISHHPTLNNQTYSGSYPPLSVLLVKLLFLHVIHLEYYNYCHQNFNQFFIFSGLCFVSSASFCIQNQDHNVLNDID